MINWSVGRYVWEKEDMALLKRNDPFCPESSGEIVTVLGPAAEFSGKLVFKGSVRIDGIFHGEIYSEGALVIGSSAQVDATVEVGSLVVSGAFRGSVVATEAVELKKPARFYGSISAPSLMVEQGVIYEGTCKMSDVAASEARSLSQPSIEVLDPVRAYEA